MHFAADDNGIHLHQKEIDAAAGEHSRVIEMASSLVDSLHDRFDAESFRDSYRDRVLELIGMKARGEEPDLPDAPEPQEAPDLMAALEASLAGSGSDSSRAKRSKARG